MAKMTLESDRALLVAAGYFHFQLDRLDAATLKQLAARLPENKCCFCGESFRGWGNNPSPVMEREGAVACGECNIAIVHPQRFRIHKHGADAA